MAADSRTLEQTHPVRDQASALPRRWRRTRAGTAAGDAIREEQSASQIRARDHRYRLALAAADVAAVLMALAVTVALFGAGPVSPLTLVGVPLIVLGSKLHGLYDRDELLIRKTTVDEAPQLFQLSTLYTLLFTMLDGPLLGAQASTPEIFAFWVLLFVLTLVGRVTARETVRARVAPERCLFIGEAGAFERLQAKFAADDVNAVLVGRMSLQRPARIGLRAGDVTDLNQLLLWANAHRVIIDPQALPADEMLDFVRAAKSLGVRVSLVPRVLEVVGTSIVFDHVHGMTLLAVRRFGLTRSSAFVKRAFDLAGATVGLLLILPVLAVIALAIKIDSRGPVLFRQTRVGRDGRHFRICKFRTMCLDAEERKQELRDHNECSGGLFKISDDPRVTRVGRLLRRTSLDELPQLFNVLAGDMSLVGPRPLVLDEDQQITGWDRRRLQLTPGMTGHWQILGSSRVPLPEMVKIDYLYVAGWSLWSDIKILLRTVPYVLNRRGQ